MRHLVSDNRAYAAVIDRVIRVRIEERRLQNPGGEYDFIHIGVVIGVHRWRRHAPVSPIHWFADFLEVAIHLEMVGPNRVENVRTSVHREQ